MTDWIWIEIEIRVRELKERIRQLRLNRPWEK